MTRSRAHHARVRVQPGRLAVERPGAGRQELVPDASHYIQFDRPDVVVVKQPNGIAWDAANHRWIVVSFDQFSWNVVALTASDSVRTLLSREKQGKLDGVEVLPSGGILFRPAPRPRRHPDADVRVSAALVSRRFRARHSGRIEMDAERRRTAFARR